MYADWIKCILYMKDAFCCEWSFLENISLCLCQGGWPFSLDFELWFQHWLCSDVMANCGLLQHKWTLGALAVHASHPPLIFLPMWQTEMWCFVWTGWIVMCTNYSLPTNHNLKLEFEADFRLWFVGRSCFAETTIYPVWMKWQNMVCMSREK